MSSVSIGRPIINTQIYILDRYLQLVPIGVPGEIHVAGLGVGRGYLKRPQLTEEKFIPNPFSNEPKSRLYKTGDLGRWLPNGNIEFLGRIDHQVKIRGLRIELGEIESVLNNYPQIQQAVVIATEELYGSKRLVAYVISDDESLTTQQLREFLKQKLPEYMIPSAFVTLDTLPLTPNGKVDRRALPIPDLSERNITTEAIAPRTTKEATLAALWTEVLGKEIIGIHDNFFELGGDSILAIQLIARAKQVGLQFTPKQLFQHQTIAKLAAITRTNVLIRAEQNLVTGLVPLTPIQQWFFEQNFSHPDHYNQSVLLEVPPEIQTELLEQVVSKLVQHHDALRLGYTLSESGWSQTNLDVNEIVPIEIDLSKLPVEQQQATLEAIANDTQASLNLSAGDIIKTVLFRLGKDRPARLLIVIHHLAVDGVSWRIILEDFSTAYQQLSRGETIQLPPKTSAFKHWAERLHEYKQSEKLATELDYWLSQSDSKILPLPQDYSDDREANTLASAERISISLSVEQTQALLQEVPATYNTQINDVLLTALVQTLARWTGERSLLVDLESHGREELFADLDLSRTVGWFTSVFPVLLEPENIDDPGAALKSIKEQLRFVPNLGIGYGILRYLCQDSATKLKLENLPQAQVSFNYLGQLDLVQSEAELVKLAKEPSGLAQNPQAHRSHLLEIEGFVSAGKLHLDWIYSKKIHQHETVERLVLDFIETLQAIISHCQESTTGGYTPSDFPDAQLDQEELDDLLVELNG